MEVNIRLCEECNDKDATMVCRCTNPPTVLCFNHIPDHIKKSPTMPHLMLPITTDLVF
jgi:hypothetical protein